MQEETVEETTVPEDDPFAYRENRPPMPDERPPPLSKKPGDSLGEHYF